MNYMIKMGTRFYITTYKTSRYGVSREAAFVNRFGKLLGVMINPEKKKNKYIPDLWSPPRLKRGDLKVQHTPFFRAKQIYGMDPQTTVTFNKKDRINYNENYMKSGKEVEIYFWVDWLAVRFVSGQQDIRVNPMCGVWFIPFSKLDPVLEKAPLHGYQQRVGDTRGNAQESYLVSLAHPDFQRVA